MTSFDFEWYPGALLRPHDASQQSQTHSPFGLVVLNQPITQETSLYALWQRATVRVAADAGANRTYDLDQSRGSLGLQRRYDGLDLIIGDLDSLRQDVRDHYTSLESPADIIHDLDQESTDFGKAVSWIRTKHESTLDIVALGGLGGRVDQGLSQLHHLYLFQEGPGYELGRMYLLSSQSLTFLLKPGRHSIRVREDGEQDVFGKHVGIIPVGEPSVISTRGLEWDVRDYETRFGGRISTSNHVLPDTKVVEIETTKEVIFTIALADAE